MASENAPEMGRPVVQTPCSFVDKKLYIDMTELARVSRGRDFSAKVPWVLNTVPHSSVPWAENVRETAGGRGAAAQPDGSAENGWQQLRAKRHAATRVTGRPRRGEARGE